MNSWKHLFTSAILSRGLSYYRLGNVSGLTKTGNGYTAAVSGSSGADYRTEIICENGKPVKFSCTCPWAEDGHRCKHMAALLYAAEAGESRETPAKGASPAPPETAGAAASVKPGTSPAVLFPPVPDTPLRNRYYDFGEIGKNLIVTERDLSAAKSLLSKSAVSLGRTENLFLPGRGNESAVCVIRASFREGRSESEMQLVLEKEKLRSFRCDACGCYSYYAYDREKKPCVHLIAALLLTFRRFTEDDPGDATDYGGNRFLSVFRKEQPSSAAPGADETSIHLIPRLESRGEALHLTFRAGTRKLYVLRNLTEFADAVRERRSFEFGKALSADFSRDAIAEDSAALFSFLRRCTSEEKARNAELKEQYPGLRLKDIGASIPLFSHRLDDLYSLIEGKTVLFVHRGDRDKDQTVLTPQDGMPRLPVRIRKYTDRAGCFQGIEASGRLPERFEGALYDYYPHGSALFRAEKRGVLDTLYELKDENGEFSFRIGRLRLGEFYRNLLPKLREFTDTEVEDWEELESLLPSEPAFTFYLDLLKDRILLKAEVSYGDRVYSALDVLRPVFPDRLRRMPGAERGAAELLLRWFPDEDLPNDLLSAEHSDDRLYHLLSEGIPALRALGDVQATDRFRLRRLRKSLNVSVGVSVKSGVMEFSVNTPDLSVSELAELLSSYREKKTYHRLRDGSFVDLNESVKQLSGLMEDLELPLNSLAEKSITVPAFRALYVDRVLQKNEALRGERDRAFRGLIRSFRTVDDSEFNVPSLLRASLRNYQLYGFRWLKTLSAYRFGGILADDMGLGKTLQIIAWIASEKAPGRTVLIVTPASLLFNWTEEFRKFAPALRVLPVSGSQEEREDCVKNAAAFDVLVTSYDLLKRDIGLYDGISFSCEVIDEAQYIKNHTTAAAKCVKAVNAAQRFALTGTPVENRLSELWSIFDFLMPGFLFRYADFREELELPITKRNDPEAMQRLRELVSPFILRRLKGDVLKELPEKLEETRYAKFGQTQQQLYDAQVLSMKNLLDETPEEDFQSNRLRLLSELTKLRQICCDPSLLYENYEGGSAKREACLELVESAVESGHRILLFSQFTSMLAILERELTERGLGFLKLTGSTPKKTRMELIRTFQEEQIPVFLISLKAGGTGINLTAADIVIHYDPWWNIAAENQATDRAHRIGQEKAVSVFRLIGKDTVEEKIQELQETKRALADAVLSGEGAKLTEMTKEDLYRLLS